MAEPLNGIQAKIATSSYGMLKQYYPRLPKRSQPVGIIEPRTVKDYPHHLQRPKLSPMGRVTWMQLQQTMNMNMNMNMGLAIKVSTVAIISTIMVAKDQCLRQLQWMYAIAVLVV